MRWRYRWPICRPLVMVGRKALGATILILALLALDLTQLSSVGEGTARAAGTTLTLLAASRAAWHRILVRLKRAGG